MNTDKNERCILDIRERRFRRNRCPSITHRWQYLFLFALLLTSTATAQDLRILHSRHYRIHTDVDAAFAEELARRLDGMHDEYARRLADFKVREDGQTLDVYIFRRQIDYIKFTGNRLPNTAGVFMPARNLLAAFQEVQGRDQLRRTLQHEAFHQFAFKAMHQDLPIWLNEGLAQLFEEGIWTGEKFWLGQVPPRRVRQLQADITAGRIIDFEKMLSMPHEQWGENLSRDPELGSTQYNQSWAMVHFLVYATDANGNAKYRKRLEDLLRLIDNGKPADAAFRIAFSPNIKGFQDRFNEWAARLQATPEATLIERQDVLADMMKSASSRDTSFDSIEAFRKIVERSRYRLTYTKGQMTWKSESDPMVYFSALDGRRYNTDELFFESRTYAPLPDVVCRPTQNIQLRTRFHTEGDRTEHEVLIEPRRR